MALNPFLASGTFDQDERLPKAGVPLWEYGLFGFATGSGLLLIRWDGLYGSTGPTKPILSVLRVRCSSLSGQVAGVVASDRV